MPYRYNPFSNKLDFVNSVDSLPDVTSDGQLFIGSSVQPNVRVGTLTSSDASVTITVGNGTIDLKAPSGPIAAETLTGNSGGAITALLNNINTVGSGSIAIAGVGGTHTLTTALTGLTDHNVLVGAGTDTITKVAPSVTSGVALISQGAAADPAFGTVVVAGGGTGATTLTGILIGNGTSAVTASTVTQYGAVIAGASNAVTSVAPTATTGVPLVSNGAASNPTFTTCSVAGGGTGAVTLTGVLTGNGTSAVTANTITQYGVVVAGASNAVASVSPSATSGIPLISQGNAANPTFGTAVVAGGGTGIVTTTAYGVICGGTTATGNFQNAGAGLSGQILVSNGAAALPSFQAYGVTTWSVITVDQAIAVNNGYICNKGSALLLSLPATSAVGTVFEVTGINTALGWKITQAAGQQIFFSTASTTLGATGYLQSSATRDSIKAVCVVADTVWNVISSVGNITVA